MTFRDPSLVTVVVPTFNSERFLEKSLLSIRKQTYKNIEIIVVDNYSTDKTYEIAQKYARVFFKGPERSSQRNLGSRNAFGDYLFFIDSDMELTPKVVEDCIKEALEKEVHAIIVPEVSVGEGFWTKCKALERSCYVGDESIEAARFFKKDIFLELGSYDEELIGPEDWDLNQRFRNRGFKIARINAFIQHHEGKLTLRKTMMKKRVYGKTLRLYKMKHTKEASLQLRLFRPAYLKNWRKLAKDPLHAIGMILMKFCEFSAVLIGSCE